MKRIEEIGWWLTLPRFFKGVLHSGNPLEVAYVMFKIPLGAMAADMGLTEGQVRHYIGGRTPLPKKRLGAAISVLRKVIVGARIASIDVPQEYHGVTVFKEEITLLLARIRAAEIYLQKTTKIKTADDEELRHLYAKELRQRIRNCSRTIDRKNWPAGFPRPPDKATERASNLKMAKIFKAELKSLEEK